MSDWSTRRESIEAVITGTVNVTTIKPGLEPADKFDSGDFPVLMVGSFVESATELPWQQRETTSNVAVLYWDLASQEDMSATADAIRDAINTASGTGAVVAREMGEVPDRGLRVVRFEVEDVAVGGISRKTVGSAGGTALENVVEDLTPQLGGNLDAQGFNLSNVGAGSFTGDLDLQGVLALANKTNPEKDAIPSPQAGWTIFNTTSGTVNVHDGTSWRELSWQQ